MIIVWLGSLAVLLNRFCSSLFKVERIKESYDETAKRYGVYYFCIDDLPL